MTLTISNPWRHIEKMLPEAVVLADRHYSRRKVGSPQFMPPGETVVLMTEDAQALFGWWRPHPDSGIVAMHGLDGWTCSIFRNEGPELSSQLILAAEAWLYMLGKTIGPDGLMTWVWNAKIRSTNPGYCFQKAGWAKTGRRSVDGKKTLLMKSPQVLGSVIPQGWAQYKRCSIAQRELFEEFPV